MNPKLNTIFSESGCPAEGVLQKYLDGKLTHDQRHEVEKHLIDCEMCSDELDGLRLMNDPKRLNVVIDRLNNRIDSKFKIKQMRPFYNFTRIAAVILAFVVIGSLLLLYNHYNKAKTDNYLTENIKKDTVTLEKEAAMAEKEEPDTTPIKVEEKVKTTETLLAQNRMNVSNRKEMNAPAANEQIIENKDVAEVDNFMADEMVEPENVQFDSLSGVLTGSQDKNIASGYNDDSTQYDLAKNDIINVTEEKLVSANEASGASADYLAETTTTKGNRAESKKAKEVRSTMADETIVMAPTVTSADNDVQKEESVSRDRNMNYEDVLNTAMDDYTTENYKDAKDKFEQILNNKNFVNYQKAQWYYALTLIKLNNKSKAKKILNQIIDTPNHQYANEAKVKLLELTDGN